MEVLDPSQAKVGVYSWIHKHSLILMGHPAYYFLKIAPEQVPFAQNRKDSLVNLLERQPLTPLRIRICRGD